MFAANKAGVGALGPALTAILLTLDKRMGWELGPEFWGSVLTVAFLAAVYFIPNVAKEPVTADSKSGDAA